MYRVYLDDMLLPVAPEQIQLKIANNNKTITLINEGEVNILKTPGLSKITFEALLPNTQYPFAAYDGGFQPAEHFLNKLEQLKLSLKPFKFQIVRTDNNGVISAFDQEMDVSLEEYQVDEDAEDYGRDISVSVTLLQYKAWVTKTITFQTTSAGTTAPATADTARDTTSAPSAKSYTVVSGDSLWAIAKKQLGSGARYTEIYNLNSSVIESTAKSHGRASSSNGHWIYPGTVLTLP